MAIAIEIASCDLSECELGDIEAHAATGQLSALPYFDSLDTIELWMTFEEAFNIEIPEEDAEKMITVEDAIDYVEKQKVV